MIKFVQSPNVNSLSGRLNITVLVHTITAAEVLASNFIIPFVTSQSLRGWYDLYKSSHVHYSGIANPISAEYSDTINEFFCTIMSPFVAAGDEFCLVVSTQ